MEHFEIVSPGQGRFESKGSIFLSRVFYCKNKKQLIQEVEDAWKEHPKARHVVTAYRFLTDGQITEAVNDDGEPSGTAGKPLLNLLQKKAVVDGAIIVVRYFGGVKLGTGGLVKAYTTAGAAGIVQSVLEPRREYVESKIFVEFAQESSLRRIIAELGVEIVDVVYGKGVALLLKYEKKMAPQLEEAIYKLDYSLKLKIVD